MQPIKSKEKEFSEKRPVDLVVLSDVHLGTYGCRAKELHRYLKSIRPKKVVLNGDIIDMWQFNKRYFPKSHMRIINRILKWVKQGVEVHYITGNHDEMLRKFAGMTIGTLSIENKLLLELDGKKVWIFHGDVFDVTMKHSKWLARLGAHGYDTLIVLNAIINWCSERMGRGRISLSKSIKNSVKSAVKFINDFESTCADIAIQNKYDYVVCGHIHQPEIRKIIKNNSEVTYMNSGDWIENLSALEYSNGAWTLFRYTDAEFSKEEEHHFQNIEKEMVLLDDKEVFEILAKDFIKMTGTD
jgi:UDP-2,3-diacylglucosamine pyrophosphatase LpxH